MPLFPEVQVSKEKDAIEEGMRQIRSHVVAIRGKLADFDALKVKWDKGLGSVYAKAEIDKLTAAIAALKQFTPTVDAFLATDLGV